MSGSCYSGAPKPPPGLITLVDLVNLLSALGARPH
jgi:hypothetical protein